MVDIGKYNQLKVLRFVEFGALLDGQEDGEILLPRRWVSEDLSVGDTVEVFIFFDSEDRLTATTERPRAIVGDFALLEVVSVNSIGAFLNWGLAKDLFLPFAEQTRSLRVGESVMVYLYVDKTDRIAASMRLDRNIEKTGLAYKEEQQVAIQIAARTDLGYKAIVEGRHWGLLYSNEVFKPLELGQKLTAFVKKVRFDGKLDLNLQRAGHKAGLDITPQILEYLQSLGGFAPLNEKTAPEKIYDLFGVSKKKYKIAIGVLYKKKFIVISDEGLTLTAKGKEILSQSQALTDK